MSQVCIPEYASIQVPAFACFRIAKRAGRELDKTLVEFTKNPTGPTNLVFSLADIGIVAAKPCRDRRELIIPISRFRFVDQF